MRPAPTLAPVLAVSLALMSGPALAQTPPLYASAADVQAAIARAKAAHKSGNTSEHLVAAPGYPVQLEYRTAETPPTIHPTEAELIEVIEGGCTLVTGGTLTGIKPATPGATTLSGAAIEGGSARKLAKGDYVMVPANTPHWYRDVRGELIIVTLHMPAGASAR